MTTNAILQLSLFVVVLVALVKPLGAFMGASRCPEVRALDEHDGAAAAPRLTSWAQKKRGRTETGRGPASHLRTNSAVVGCDRPELHANRHPGRSHL